MNRQSAYADCVRHMAPRSPWRRWISTSPAGSASLSWAPTGPARPPPWRSSQGTGRAAGARATRFGVVAGGRMLEIATPATLGGRDEAATIVSWDGPAGRETMSTDTPTAEVLKLSERCGGEVPGLTVSRPTLEEIYLNM